MACSLALSLGCPTQRVGTHLPVQGPSSLPHWLHCSQPRSGGVPRPRRPLAPPPPPPRPRHPRRPPLAPALVTRRALAFPLNLR